MKSNYQNKIHTLLASEDMENVRMGLELVQSLASSEEELRQLISFPSNSSTVAVLDDYLKQTTWKHYVHIKVWLLEFLFRLETSWVKKLTTLNLIEHNLKSLPAFIKELPNLSYLYLKDNPLVDFPAEVLYNKGLNILDLRGISLSHIVCTEQKLNHVLYNDRTVWPEGFDVEKSGALQISNYASLEGANLQHVDHCLTCTASIIFSTAIDSGRRCRTRKAETQRFTN